MLREELTTTPPHMRLGVFYYRQGGGPGEMGKGRAINEMEEK